MSLSRAPRSRRQPLAALAWIVVAAITLASCQKEDAVKSMSFRVDASLLGPPVSDTELRLTFRPPLPMVAAPAEFLRGARAEVEAQPVNDPVLDLVPTQVFADPSGEMRVFLSRFRVPPKDGLKGEWRKSYEDRARAKVLAADPQAEISVDDYRIGPVPVMQMRVAGKGYTNFRLVAQVEGEAPLQIDYLIPTSRYREMARAVESSIGSLEFHRLTGGT